MPENQLEHIAIILDGNKRWAKKNKVSYAQAYKEGLQNIKNLIDTCLQIRLPYLTLFTLSSENIKRKSVNNIYKVIYDDFAYFFDKIIEKKLVKLKVIGSKENLPEKILNLINHCEKQTYKNNNLYLNLAFNYGFKEEVRYVLHQILNNTKIDLNVDENIKKLFFLGSIPDPDLLIRTGGDKRLSNFIMYNLTYTEIFFIDTLWPDFNEKELMKITNIFKNISRRYGL